MISIRTRPRNTNLYASMPLEWLLCKRAAVPDPLLWEPVRSFAVGSKNFQKFLERAQTFSGGENDT